MEIFAELQGRKTGCVRLGRHEYQLMQNHCLAEQTSFRQLLFQTFSILPPVLVHYYFMSRCSIKIFHIVSCSEYILQNFPLFLTLPTVMIVPSSSVTDPDHFDTDLDPTFDFDTDPDPCCFNEDCAMYLKRYFLYILT